MRYVGLRDLLGRWVYTRQGLYKFMGRDDFPAPAFTVNQGRTKVWDLAVIEAYEQHYPELTDQAAKTSKSIGYFLAIQKGNGRAADEK
jgi:hypothetical protein